MRLSRDYETIFASGLSLLASLLAVLGTIGCNGLVPEPPASAGTIPQTYMAPVVAALNNGPTIQAGSATVNQLATAQLATYLIDDNGDCSVKNGISCFSQSTTTFSGTQQGTSVNNAGTLGILQRGLRSLQTTFTAPYAAATSGGITMNYSSPLYPNGLAGSYALELSGQAGGLVQLLSQPATPIVATSACPSIGTAQTFQFITLPAAVVSSSTPATQLTWSPAQETAFGSVSISTQGTSVNFSNIQQFTLPPVSGGAPGTPVLPPPATPPMGTCTLTPYGETISVPGQLVLTNPGNGQGVTPAATLGIGPSGLLVESNGNPPVTGAAYTGGVEYNNVLGAGTGAVGLPQPSQALGSSPVSGSTAGTGPQYLGFLYGTGHFAPSLGSTAPTSNIVSFGFSSLPPNCPALTPSTATPLLYGGDFPINLDPASLIPDATPANKNNLNYPYGNCNLAIDLGLESATSHGLYPTATVWIGKSYIANSSAGPVTYSFPAVAIAGQLGGKYAIFVIGNDSTSSPSQAWSLYLLQSN